MSERKSINSVLSSNGILNDINDWLVAENGENDEIGDNLDELCGEEEEIDSNRSEEYLEEEQQSGVPEDNILKPTEQYQSCGISICRKHSMRLCHGCLQ